MRIDQASRSPRLQRGFLGTAWQQGLVLTGILGSAGIAAAEDLAARFPNLVMPPILANSAVEEPQEETVPPPGFGDFATIVEEAKREAMGLPALNARSVAGPLAQPAGRADGTTTRFVPLSQRDRSGVDAQGNQGHPATRLASAQPKPPAAPAVPKPNLPGAPASPALPPANSALPPATSAPANAATATAKAVPPATNPDPADQDATPADAAVVPLPELAAQGQAAVPDLRQELNRQLARSDVGGLRENWSDAPNIVGDGCAPQGAPGQLAVGRICIIAPGLTGNPLENTGNAATLNVLTKGQFNNIKAIQASGYPAFTLPATGLGNVAGTPPTTVPVAASPGAGITGVGSPSTFTAAANNTFATSPALNTSQYSNLNPKTVFDSANSGALPNPAGSTTQDAFLFYNYVIDANVILPGYAVGFVKLTENQSPIPRDRVYMTYSYFSNANFYPTKADVNRFMPGFEKTFFDGWSSVEIRTPFAATLSNGQTIMPGGSGVSEYRDIQFGNMSVIFKTFVWEEKTWAFTTGAQVMLPTANNTFVNGVNALGQNIQNVYVANESVHVMPFLGGIWAPNERWFNQGLLQVETDVNGNLAYVNNDFQTGIAGRDLTQVGRIRYPNFMYISLGTGYWLYKDNTQNFTGFAPVMEVHVNQALGEYCPIQAYGYQLGPNLGQVSVTNGLVGCNFEWGERSTLTFAYVTPLGGGVDRFFDGEFRALYNWRFGPQNRLTRAQF